jgi:hypothetical protein
MILSEDTYHTIIDALETEGNNIQDLLNSVPDLTADHRNDLQAALLMNMAALDEFREVIGNSVQ